MEKYIQLSDKYYIGADKYQWILYTKELNKKTNEVKMKAIKFYPTLESLLEKTLEMNLRGLVNDRKSLTSLIVSMSNERKKCLKSILAMCEGINKDMFITENKKGENNVNKQ